MLLTIWAANAKGNALKKEESFLQKPCQEKYREKVAKLHFYVQDELRGQDATVWEVARSKITSDSATSFGLVRVMDDLITSDPDPNSKKLGRAQGLITFSDLKESALNMNVNFYFTGGKYRGSTLCVLGRNPISNKIRELPVVGGTGTFHMARGYSITNMYAYNTSTDHGVLEYSIFVVYLEKKPCFEAAINDE
ncbi:hypothetical protein CDL12_17249 [Handroanthus impetiginosus]|uniref:Dirigent protein n=1 Tax=Handroanthus impetiginosus TaxID=429701 RepID=A0A2G9GY29_9LAMI|nr:hypothetical protein CDL12_17249 [Handroanthus impetiginosus]